MNRRSLLRLWPCKRRLQTVLAQAKEAVGTPKTDVTPTLVVKRSFYDDASSLDRSETKVIIQRVKRGFGQATVTKLEWRRWYVGAQPLLLLHYLIGCRLDGHGKPDLGCALM